VPQVAQVRFLDSGGVSGSEDEPEFRNCGTTDLTPETGAFSL